MSELWPLPDDPIVAEVDRICERLDLAQRYRDLDRTPGFPRDEFRALGRARLLGLSIPSELGGRGLSPRRAAVGLFRFAYRAGTAFAKLAMQPEFCSVLAYQGSPELRERWFARLMLGEALVGNQVTEPTAGADAQALALEAARDGDEYVLTGTKSEAAFAIDADAAIVYARAPGTHGAEGVTAFLAPQDLPGVRREMAPTDLGERWQRRGTVVYDHVRLAGRDRIGDDGEGFGYLRRELAQDRGLLAAIYLGAARASWEETVAYAGTRATFGHPLGERQAVAFPLVDDGAQLEAVWLFTERALGLLESGKSATADTAMAKVLATEVALRTLDHCIQFHGGPGYSAAWPHEQRWRDVRSGPIAHGPSEVLREIAARRLWRPGTVASGAPPSAPGVRANARGSAGTRGRRGRTR